MKRVSRSLPLILLFIFGLYRPLLTFAAPPVDHSRNTVLKEAWNAVDLRASWLNFTQFQQPAASDINDGNRLRISDHTFGSFFRPDLLATFPYLGLSVNPRLELRRNHWDDGPDKGRSKTDADFFVNEYAVRLPVREDLLLSYGREDLQWGPAFLLSPSNPFFSYNGRDQPKKEVPGADYGKLIWTPNLNWSCSLIINTSKGRKKLLTAFKKTYAAKIDYLAEKAYFSLIASTQEHMEHKRLGGFLSWNLSDATILYGEGSFSADELEALTGCSYTFGGGGTISTEYFYNGNGAGHGSLIKKLATLNEADGRENFFRRHYALLQYYDSDPLSRWNILLRETINLDDGSSSLLAHGEYNVGDHTQLFASGTLNQGNRQGELASLTDFILMIGLELSY